MKEGQEERKRDREREENREREKERVQPMCEKDLFFNPFQSW